MTQLPSSLIAVTKPSDRNHTSASAAFCRHTWRFMNVPVIDTMQH